MIESTNMPRRWGNAKLAAVLAVVGLALYLSIQLVWAAKGW